MKRLNIIMTILCLTASSMSMAETPVNKLSVADKLHKAISKLKSKCGKNQFDEFEACSNTALVGFLNGAVPEIKNEDDPKVDALWSSFRKCLHKYCPNVRD